MLVMDLRGVTSKSGLLDKVRVRVEDTHPRHWIRGYGFEESKLSGMPTLSELDLISPENPVYLEDIDSKLCVLNSLALEKVYEGKDVEGVKIERNEYTREMTGLIRAEDWDSLSQVVRMPTIDPVDESLDVSELEWAIEIACLKLMEAGITSAHDLQVPPNGLRAYKRVIQKGKMPLRLYIGFDRGRDIELKEYLDLKLGVESRPSRMRTGLVKIFADGRVSDREFKSRVREAHEAGYQLAIHSLDDLEVERSLEAVEEALRYKTRKDHRHRIEHAFISNRYLVDRIKNLELIVSSQSEFLYEFDGDFPVKLEATPQKSMIEKGIRVVGGSDSPLIYQGRGAPFPRTFPTPLIGVGFEVSGKAKKKTLLREEDRIPFLEALKIHTINGAYASFEEEIKGTLEVGKLADLVVLSDDPLQIDPEEIKNLRVLKTLIGGNTKYAHALQKHR
jgi:predicted amidohydrolase YtcJ